MAYQRPKLTSQAQLTMSPSELSLIESQSADRDDKLKAERHAKPLLIFTLDISHWSHTVQSIILVGGLILFMCLYGYYQELVIYGWFNRQLSLFSTFLHFLGCSVFAQISRNYSYKPPANGHSYGMSMGTAPQYVALGYYMLLVITKTAAQGMSNLCMTQINYPAKVLFKSANPVITMLIGVCWFKKSYPLRDYLVVVLLLAGLYIFITSDLHNTPHSTYTGIVYVVLSMVGSAGVPMIQEHCIHTYHASTDDLIYFCYVGSTLVSLALSVANGEFSLGVAFLLQSSSLHTWVIFVCFCSFGFVGSTFSTLITAQYGSLVNGICNTFRKALTISLSYVMFPERNELNLHRVVGAAVFFSGLVVRMASHSGSRHHAHAAGSPVHGQGGRQGNTHTQTDGSGREAQGEGEKLGLLHVVSEDSLALSDNEDSSSSEKRTSVREGGVSGESRDDLEAGGVAHRA